MNKSINFIAALILAISLRKDYQNLVVADCQADEEGFWVDVSTQEPISINDFSKLEKNMHKIISSASNIEYSRINDSDAVALFKNNYYLAYNIKQIKGMPFIIKINDFKWIGNEQDIASVNKIKALKLLSLGGSYWQADADKEQLTRIKGVAFENKELLQEYMLQHNERMERDHRNIGKNLELFTFDNLAGQGLPIWLQNGTVIRNQIRNLLNEMEFKYGFESVCSPVLGNIDLYKQSGHWAHYRHNMFPPMQVEDEKLVLRPMTCPHHILIYKRKLFSYKQLPIRICEESMLHRYESSGGLTGFERVREMVLEDTHIFCTPDQVQSEVFNCYNLIQDVYAALGCQIHQIDLSLHDVKDKEKFHDNQHMWSSAESDLRSILKEKDIDFVEKVGEAAFYGPKIDFQVKTALNRIITISTIQLDFLLPERFGLEYKDQNGQMRQPIMIHLGIIGTYERLLSVLLEQTKGILPIWLSPRQVAIIPIADSHVEYATSINTSLRQKFIRTFLDNRDDRIAKKIREAQMKKIPYQIIIGDNEVKDKTISVRKFGDENSTIMSLKNFEKIILNQITEKE